MKIGKSHVLLVERLNCLVAMENIWHSIKKINIGLLPDSEILLLGIYPKELKTRIQTNTQMFIDQSSQQLKIETIQSPTDGGITKSGMSIQWNIIQS